MLDNMASKQTKQESPADDRSKENKGQLHEEKGKSNIADKVCGLTSLYPSIFIILTMTTRRAAAK